MNTIQCWITREPKGQFENQYMLHFSEPTLAAHDLEFGSHSVFWHSNSETSYTINPAESYGLNPGECKEWVMVKKEGF